MRYYLVRISYNKVAQAEDRPQPTGYDSLSEAEKAFHNFFSQNILGSTIGWCEAFILDSLGGVDRAERWEEETDPDDLVERIKSGELNYSDVVLQYPKYKSYIDEQLQGWWEEQNNG